jgi:transposase-like protein
VGSSTAKVDYKTLEREYITSDVSIREISRKYDISWSAVATHARRNAWAERRKEFAAEATRRGMADAGARIAGQAGQIREEAVNVMRATLYAYAQNLKEKPGNVSTRDAALAVDKLLLLIGEPTSRTEEHHVFESGELSAADLRDLIGAARARLVEGSSREIAPGGVEETGA